MDKTGEEERTDTRRRGKEGKKMREIVEKKGVERIEKNNREDNEKRREEKKARRGRVEERIEK